jgi:hypothetical protein
LLHDIGVIPAEAIVRWADDQIVSQEHPAAALIELSTAPRHRVRDTLSEVAAGADIWRPIFAALPDILAYVSAEPDRAPIVADALYHVAVSQRYIVPDGLRFILSADDDFSLAQSGVFVFDDVYHRFLADIRAEIEIA